MTILVPSHKPDSITMSVDPAAVEQRDTAVDVAGFVTTVDSPQENEQAVDSLKELRVISKAVEAARKDLKRPVTDLARLIDGTAEAFLKPVVIEETRLQSLCAGYQQRIEAARIKALKEEQAKRDAILAEERKKQEEIEQARLKALSEAKSAADQEAANAAAEADQKRLEDASAAKQAELIPVHGSAPQKVAGASVARPWQYEVTDADALYKARPDLVEIVPRARFILDAVRNGAREIPGLRIWQDTQIRVRTP
jgi:membrane protein involved in colicin uptake